jgi:hypothetical protein
MPRPKKRVRSAPKSIQQIKDADAVRSSRRTKSNPKSNDVKAYSSTPRSGRGKRKKEEEEEENGVASDVDDDGEEQTAEEVTVKEEEEEKKKEEDEVEEIFECPTCKKKFTSKYGRKYHVGE